jgi:hypothetical protein
MKIFNIITVLVLAISFNLSAQNGQVVDDFIYTNKKQTEKKVSSSFFIMLEDFNSLIPPR